jgi:hypothetical protein
MKQKKILINYKKFSIVKYKILALKTILYMIVFGYNGFVYICLNMILYSYYNHAQKISQAMDLL